MIEKHGVDIPKQSLEQNVQRLTNQIWKLIPMRENGENWQDQLQTVLIEIIGLNELFKKTQLLQLISLLEGILKEECEFSLFRRIIFKCISLIQELI